MNKSSVTKTINKLNSDKIKKSAQKQSWSVGFLRYFVLPESVKKKIMVDWLFEKGNTHWYKPLISRLDNMSDSEYNEFLIQL